MVILADRGFGRAEWAAVCQELRFDSLVRIRPDVTVASRRDRGPLRQDPVFKGSAHGLHDVPDRKDARVIHHVVIRWRPDLPKKRDEPWSLMTNLPRRAESLCQVSAGRMSVEELFRDQKNRRNGWALRNPRIQHADRFDRFLLILAMAYVLLAGLGLQAKLDFEPAQWCTNTRPNECSVLTIGRAMLGRCNYDPDEVLRRVRHATEQAAARWG